MTIPIDYTSKDFIGIKQSLLDYATQIFPEWTSRSEGDFGVLLVELFAYMGDILSYYGDRIANEAYIQTATQRSSVLNLASMLAYTPTGSIAATGTVTFQVPAGSGVVTLPAGTQVATGFNPNYDQPIVYETTADCTLTMGGSPVTSSAIPVVQGETILTELLGTSSGAVDQTFTLFRAPVIDGSPVLQVGDAINGFTTWTWFQFLLDATSTDNAYTTYIDGNGNTLVQLGDGVNGVIPNAGSQIQVTYRVGGGVKGNVVANQITNIVNGSANFTIVGSSAMTGGVDPESTDQIRQNAPRSFTTANRCVTLADFKNAAVGVAQVSDAIATGTIYTSITVYIALASRQQAATALINQVKTSLTNRALTGVSVTVQPATYANVNVGAAGGNEVAVNVLPTYQQTVVKNAVAQAITSYILSLSFGSRVSVVGVYQAIAQVPGVNYAIVPLLARADGTQSGVNDAVMALNEIPNPGNVVVVATGGIT